MQYGANMVICVGESLMDVVYKNGAVTETVGGCPLNVAITIARLDASVALFTKVSRDSYGNQILEKLINDCVMFEPQLCNSNLPTLCSKAYIDEQGNARYVFDWKQTVASNITAEEISKAFSVMTDIDFVMTGSLILTFPLTRDAIFPAIDTVNPKPVVFYDPNVRPAVIENMDDFKEKLLHFAQKSDIVKVSEDDLKLVFPEISQEEAIKTLQKVCKLHLILTSGEKGATWYAPSFKVSVPAYSEKDLVDTIGCGDVFSGAILAMLQKRKNAGKASVKDITEEEAKNMLSFATKLASNNCKRKGCDPLVDLAVDLPIAP